MYKIFNFFFVLLNLLDFFLKKFFKRNLLFKIKKEIEKKSYLKKKILNKNVNFFIPNELVEWRVNTLLQKEPETIDWINSFFTEKKTIFWDIGANIGIYSIYASIKHKNIEIICFEPSTSNLRTLSRNISINNLNHKIKIVPLPLSSKKNFFSIIKESEFIEGGALNVFAENFDQKGKIINNKTHDYGTLGTNMNFFIEEKILEIPNYIKIDVDGIEHLVLEGGNLFLSNKNIKSILIEINEDFENQFNNIHKIMRDNNFKFYKKDREDKFYGSNFKNTYNYIFYR